MWKDSCFTDQTQVHKWVLNLNEINKTHNPSQRGCGEYRKRGQRGETAHNPLQILFREKEKKEKK